MNTKTRHTIIIGSSGKLDVISPQTIHLVVTSPPYPMIDIWDTIMAHQNPAIRIALENSNGPLAFELMHQELDRTWQEIERVLIPGGIVCINIGDATRTLNEDFALYSNHARVIWAFLKLGFVNLPNIIWRKQTNAPNKFMGSGMLPAGAYVTLEHEWILIFRKGGKRQFNTEEEKKARLKSSIFWEERNNWFSDIWDPKGIRQQITLPESRERSAAFPFIIPYRLINMFSLKGETVLDPFLGTGTTTIAAISCERNSIGVEIDPSFHKLINDRIGSLDLNEINAFIDLRVAEHERFVAAQGANGRVFNHFNSRMNLSVMTSQEKELCFNHLQVIHKLTEFDFNTVYKIEA